jgi:hypothetical protein
MMPILEDLENIIISTAKEELLPRFALTDRHYKADGSIVTEGLKRIKTDCFYWQALPIW